MNKRICALIMAVIMMFSLSACGKKKDTTAPDATADTTVEASVDETFEEPVEDEIDEAEASIAMYEEFLCGGEKVYTDKYDFSGNFEGDEYLYFGDNDGLTILDFYKQVMETERGKYEDFPFVEASYAFIDCGLDGVPELCMKAHFADEWDQLDREYVIKYVDGKLELTYMNKNYYRSYIEIANVAGLVIEANSYGAASNQYVCGFLNENGRYVLDYIEDTSYMATYMLGSRFDDAVAYTYEDYSTLYLRRYAFELNVDGNQFDEYEKNTFYTAQQAAGDPSNGVDFKENERIAKTLFNYVGEKLYSNDEIEQKIQDREESIGLTDDIKEAKEFEWIEIELDSDYINGIEVIYVSTADELMNSIADGTIICLAPGEYNISQWVRKNASNLPYYEWSSDSDAAAWNDGGVYIEDGKGKYFGIDYLNECILRSEDYSNPAVIVNDAPGCNVLNMNNCTNVTFDGIEIKNNARNSNYICSALVLSRCNNIEFDRCIFNGNEVTMGLAILDSSNIYADSCEICNCKEGLIQVSDSFGVTFSNSIFEDTNADVLIQTSDAALTFANSDFKRLSGELMYSDRTGETSFVNCYFDSGVQASYDALMSSGITNVYLYLDSLDCFSWNGPWNLYITDSDGEVYRLYDETKLTKGIPCYDDDCEPTTWAYRYIEHCSITDNTDPDGPYYCQGFGGSDVWQIEVDDDNNIITVIDVFAVD